MMSKICQDFVNELEVLLHQLCDLLDDRGKHTYILINYNFKIYAHFVEELFRSFC